LTRKGKRWIAVLILMTAALVACVFWNLSAGSTKIPMGQILEILSGKSADTSEASVILKIRLPRILCAMLAGGALSVSGYLLQTFFANPIAGPYILGISSGAKLFVAIVMIAFVSRGLTLGSAAQILAAFAGALAATGFVLLISTRVRSMSVLVVCGIMIGYICSAVTDLLVTFADDSNIVNLHNWSQGSFSGMNSTDAALMAAFIIPAVVLALLLSKPIGAYLLGESYAASLGVNVKGLRAALILLSSLLSATATAFAGPISFVGIAVPHLMKNASSDARPLVLIPVCFVGGAAVTLACDGLARVLFAPTEVAASSVSAVVLAPVVIVMMLRRKGGRRGG
jgi:iron complex transport system permease protein